jgi:nicotinamide-nucleotide amidase
MSGAARIGGGASPPATQREVMETIAELKRLMLAPPPLTVAVAESLTCGHVQAIIGGISGASSFFVGGLTAYTLEQKVRHLGVAREEAAACDSVSESVARQMARGAVRLFDSDIALGITGFAEATRPEGLAPYAWWALVHRQSGDGWHDVSGRFATSMNRLRTEVQQDFAAALVSELVAYLRQWRHAGASPVPAATSG